MVITQVTKDLRRLLDTQNIPWDDLSTDSIEYGLTLGFPSKLDVSFINSVDDYAFITPKTPEEVLEVLGRHGAK